MAGGPFRLPNWKASIEQAMAKANVAGLSVAIINDGRIAYTHAFGTGIRLRESHSTRIPSPARHPSARPSLRTW